MLTTAHLHPMTVHFPIALIIVGFLIDVISLLFRKDQCLSRMGYYLQVIGMVAAIGAWGTGYFFTGQMAGEAGELRETHEAWATVTLVSIIAATLFRLVIDYQKKEGTWLKYVALALFLLSFVSVIVTGVLGGRLVQDFMIGL